MVWIIRVSYCSCSCRSRVHTSWRKDLCLLMTSCMMLLRSATWVRLIVKMVGLLSFRVLDRMLCINKVELIILKVSRYVTRSVSHCVRCARLDLRLVCVCLFGFGVRTVTSLALAIIFSISLCQLALVLLMRQRERGVRRIRSSAWYVRVDV